MSINPFVDKAAELLARTATECSQAPDPYRAAANRLEEAGHLTRPPETVWGAYPVKVRRSGLMTELDVTPLVRVLLLELLRGLAEDPESLQAVAEQVVELDAQVEAEHTLDGRGPGVHARDELIDQLIEDLGGGGMRYTRADAWKLAHLLQQHAGPHIPAQQHGEAA